MSFLLKKDVSGAPPRGTYETGPDLSYELKKKSKRIVKGLKKQVSQAFGAKTKEERELEKERYRFADDSGDSSSSTASSVSGKNEEWDF